MTNKNNMDYLVEDIRNDEKSCADFRVTYKTRYSLLFALDESTNELSLIDDIENVNGENVVIKIPAKVLDYPVTGIVRFYECSYSEQIQKLIIPDSIVNIGEDVFASCPVKSVVIPESVTSIGENAFSECYYLKNVFIPASVIRIGTGAFSGCSRLSSIKVDNNNIYYDSRNNCNAIIKTQENVLVVGSKKTIIPENINEIGYSAFSHIHLTKIVIPDSVKFIGDYAFYECGYLKELFIPKSVKHIGEKAFAGCSKLQSIVVDKTNMFYDSRCNCNAIIKKDGDTLITGCKNTIIPDTIKEIGEYAFYFLSLSSLDIPKSVVKIGESAFNMCDGFERVIIPDSVKSIDSHAFDSCSVEEVFLPNSIAEIADSAFSYSELRKIIIPNSVIKIADYAFYGCHFLTEVVIPNTLTKIGKLAFGCCPSVQNLYIPESVVDIDDLAFSGCSRLLTISIDEGNIMYDSRNNCNAIIESAKNRLIQGCIHTNVPDSIEIIGNNAFSFVHIRSIIIPDSVSVIEDEAFYHCWKLEKLVLSKHTKKIGSFVFCGCSALSDIIIPDSVVEIGEGVFAECYNLQKIVIGKPSALNNANIPKHTKIEIKQPSLFDDSSVDVSNQNAARIDKILYEQAVLQKRIDQLTLQIINEDTTRSQRSIFYDAAWRLLISTNEQNPEDDEKKHLLDDALFEIINCIDLDNPDNNPGIIVFDVLKRKYFDFYDLQFIKFINIFNNTGKEQLGHISYFADFTHSASGENLIRKGKEFITNNSHKVDFNNEYNIVDVSMSIKDLLNDSIYSTACFEYSKQSKPPVFSNGYYAYKLGSLSKKYGYSKGITDLICEKEEDSSKENIFNQCLDIIDNGYSNSFTNYFLLWGNSAKKHTNKNAEIDRFCVCANVGIDINKGKKEDIIAFLTNFQRFIDKLSFCLIFEIKNHQLHQSAAIASVSQALTRNMSHNIRSHVSNNYTSNNAYEILKDDYIKQNLNNYTSSEEDKVVFPCGENLQLPYFIQYLNNRMDYLSEMTFDVPSIMTTKRFYANIFKELDRGRILLNHIPGISGFRYEFSLIYNGKTMSDQNDLSVYLPDVLGNQAVFNILENIIRNTAKHSTRHNDDKIVFNIEVVEDANFPEYYCVEIDNGINEVDITELVRKQNKILNDSVLGEDEKLRTHGLGLLEMVVAAAFLRQVDIVKVDSYEYRFENNDGYTNKYGNLILIKAINKNGALGYRFFLKKPMEFLFLGAFDIPESLKTGLAKDGINFISEEAFAKAMDKNESFFHSFMFYPNTVSEKTKTLLSDECDCKTLLPVRKIKLNKTEIQEISKKIFNGGNDVLLQLKDMAWNKYFSATIVKELKNPNNATLEILTSFDSEKDEQTETASNQVVFLNHGFKKIQEIAWEQANNDSSYEAWIENLSSRTSAKLPEFASLSIGTKDKICNYVNNISNLNRIKIELFEAFHNKVIVLDERIQRFLKGSFEGSSNEYGGPIPCQELFRSTNVHNPETPLDPITFDDMDKMEIEHYVNDNIHGAFLLIHYGILERLYHGEKTIIEEILNEWSKKAKRVVVTSGRGSHSLPLPPSVCFVNLSSVLYAFTENRNKFIINYLLNQSRRKNG